MAENREAAGGRRLLQAGLWLLIGAAAIIATAAWYWPGQQTLDIADYGGGSYALVDHRGNPFTPESLIGQPALLFFGYTNCPDVCPITLGQIAAWFEELGADAKDVGAYLVTVDPARDTAPALADYLSWAGNRVTGVTGSPDQVSSLMKAWHVTAEQVPGLDGSYTVDHTASVFLVDAGGRFRGTIAYLEAWDTAVAKLRRLATTP
ncbi:SCO family protein [Devosia sp. MSA67]|uniref:SCO family protein n=2 Tax=Devosia sediminis TaxID=2798801 RepID=A0A934IQ02_9HYPH|nr:SCO family protein [Devosia sediminis]